MNSKYLAYLEAFFIIVCILWILGMLGIYLYDLGSLEGFAVECPTNQ